MESLVPQLSKLYKFPKLDIFSQGIPARLPQAYKDFYKEWKMTTPSPVHYRPEPGKWKRNPDTGEVTPVQNIPIPVKFPKESHSQLWGGEGVVQGFEKRAKLIRRIPKFWTPTLLKTIVHSEILDKRMSVLLTETTINYIIKNSSFDNYILKTPPCDLQSLLALKLKRQMLLALFDKNFYHDDCEKQNVIYNKYKHYLEDYKKEDLEWYGLSLNEAIVKFKNIEENIKPVPLKHQYRAQLFQQLIQQELENIEKEKEAEKLEEERSWLSKINPFNKTE